MMSRLTKSSQPQEVGLNGRGIAAGLQETGQKLKILFENFLLGLTFMVNFVTLIGVLWAISKLRSDRNLGSIVTLVGEENSPERHLFIDADIYASRLDVMGGLKTNRMIGEQVIISTGDEYTGEQLDSATVGIKIDPESITMQAEQFGSNIDDDRQFELELPKKLERLDISETLTNIRSIRSDNERLSSGLEIESDDRLELSGNLGVNVHAKVLKLSSPETINIVSKEESIIIQLNGGSLLLPSLSLLDSRDLGAKFALGQGEMPPSTGANEMYHLCINQASGLLYHSENSDCL